MSKLPLFAKDARNGRWVVLDDILPRTPDGRLGHPWRFTAPGAGWDFLLYNRDKFEQFLDLVDGADWFILKGQKRPEMSKLPLFAYNLMTGKWELFPWQMLRTMPNGKLGFSWQDCRDNNEYWKLLNEHWYSFDKTRDITLGDYREYYTIKDEPVEVGKLWKCPECQRLNADERLTCWFCHQGMKNEAEEITHLGQAQKQV